MIIAYLDWSLDVECPKCDYHFDLVELDDENQLAEWIFDNRRNEIKGYEVECPNCGKEFKLDGVEY